MVTNIPTVNLSFIPTVLNQLISEMIATSNIVSWKYFLVNYITEITYQIFILIPSNWLNQLYIVKYEWIIKAKRLLTE